MKVRWKWVTILGVVLLALAVPVTQRSLRHATAQLGGQGLDGSWVITVTLPPGIGGPPTLRALITFTGDGSIVASSSAVTAPPFPIPGMNSIAWSDAHGAWVRTGGSDYGATVVRLAYSELGAHILTVKVQADLRLEPGANAWTAQGRLAVMSPDGDVVFTGEAPMSAERIKVE